ncbi:hypothetical protein CSOJ01_00714 [Colletotrichum sojae]|uniref:Uncharacterized protein n=1 Tax=Colletotrichum sojae TaxID=2175907 RepID=A0A8H6N5K2_9PEZI|nr:hypothetical protein CSOJ01_00714 [Colletotrichum sojae]
MTSSPPHRHLQNTPIAREADHRSPKKRPEDEVDRPRAMLHAPCSLFLAPVLSPQRRQRRCGCYAVHQRPGKSQSLPRALLTL